MNDIFCRSSLIFLYHKITHQNLYQLWHTIFVNVAELRQTVFLHYFPEDVKTILWKKDTCCMKADKKFNTIVNIAAQDLLI